MSEEPVIGGERVNEEQEEAANEPPERPDEEGAEVAALLREALLATHDELAPEDLAGASVKEVRERYLGIRAAQRAEVAAAPVPAGAPGRLAPAPANAFEKIREGLARLNG